MKKEKDEKSCGFQGKRCEVHTFRRKEHFYKIRECLHLDCNSENVI